MKALAIDTYGNDGKHYRIILPMLLRDFCEKEDYNFMGYTRVMGINAMISL